MLIKEHYRHKIHILLGIKVGDYTINNSECEKLLGVKIDVNLDFNDHISDICKKASRKISALATVTPFMGLINEFFFHFTVQLLPTHLDMA